MTVPAWQTLRDAAGILEAMGLSGLGSAVRIYANPAEPSEEPVEDPKTTALRALLLADTPEEIDAARAAAAALVAGG